ncbi:MAG: membrane protein insertase YidC [Solobacterium sp.]|nr:membrane protein insertase YidC [Solobacterium sp.]
MKLSPRMKKILVLVLVIGIISVASGCAIPRDADGHIVEITSTTTFKDIMSTENWFSAIFVWPLAQLINAIAPMVGVGGAIALVTIIVNGILAAATFKSTVAQQKMQLVQPELERIQRKYEGRNDQNAKVRQAQEMQALYNKYDINPGGMMLVMFLQFPIIMAMYMSVQRSSAVQHGTFLGMNLQTTPLAGFQSGQYGYIVLFVVMVLCQFISTKIPQWLADKKAKEEAAKHHRKPQETGASQKMMQYYMIFMIAAFGLMWPAAMSLYWAINSLVNIVKTLLVQKMIDKQKGFSK